MRQLYHWIIAWLAALMYGFPSRSMKIIGVTGTKGKSTATFMVAKIFEEQGVPIAMIGSLGYRINGQTWPNTLKMTMPGRWYLQQFLSKARKAGCQYVVVEVTSEGIAQHRLNGMYVDCAVFTNLHKEHIESHGSFENYMAAKKKLFQIAKHFHVINNDSQYADDFLAIPADTTYTYGKEKGEVTQKIIDVHLKLAGDFNIYNALAAITVAHVYGLDFLKAKATVENILVVPGRMEYLENTRSIDVVIDYAHTPESLEMVYQTLKPVSKGKLICVLGAAGGGRDSWKRPVFGEIAANYCDSVILTNEDPYDEDPAQIIKEIAAGREFRTILDRKEAIETAIREAQPGDSVIITGKGSETSIALSGGKKIPWSDRETATQALATP